MCFSKGLYRGGAGLNGGISLAQCIVQAALPSILPRTEFHLVPCCHLARGSVSGVLPWKQVAPPYVGEEEGRGPAATLELSRSGPSIRDSPWTMEVNKGMGMRLCQASRLVGLRDPGSQLLTLLFQSFSNNHLFIYFSLLQPSEPHRGGI